MDGNNPEEDDHKAHLAAFVGKGPLGQNCAGPAAEQFKKVKRLFRNSPLSPDGFAFVDPIGEKRDDAYHDVSAHDPLQATHANFQLTAHSPASRILRTKWQAPAAQES